MHKIYFVWVSFTLSLSLSFHLSLSFFSLLSLTPCSGGIQRKIERKGYYKRERNRGRQREEKQRERDMCYSESYGYVAHSYKQDYPFLPELQHQNLSEYPYFSRRIYKPSSHLHQIEPSLPRSQPISDILARDALPNFISVIELYLRSEVSMVSDGNTI